jgi:hypothetical protein
MFSDENSFGTNTPLIFVPPSAWTETLRRTIGTR